MVDKKDEIKEASLTEIMTPTSIGIKLEDGRIVNELEFLVLIYNKILKLERAVV